MKYFVSVIIPVYNVEDYLADCLESVLKQTLTDIEIICINDCSPDGSAAILSEYAKKDERIRVINMPVNSGLSAVRNTGIKEAQGKYIYFLDSDDELVPETLKECWEMAEKNNCDQVIFSAKLKIEKGAKYDATYQIPEDLAGGVYPGAELLAELAQRWKLMVSACFRFSRLDFLRQHKILFPAGLLQEDNYFSVKAMILAGNVGVLNKEFYIRRVRPNSIMTIQTDEQIYKRTKSYLQIYYLFATEMRDAFYSAQQQDALFAFMPMLIGGVVDNMKKIPESLVLKMRDELLSAPGGETIKMFFPIFQVYGVNKNRKPAPPPKQTAASPVSAPPQSSAAAQAPVVPQRVPVAPRPTEPRLTLKKAVKCLLPYGLIRLREEYGSFSNIFRKIFSYERN